MNLPLRFTAVFFKAKDAITGKVTVETKVLGKNEAMKLLLAKTPYKTTDVLPHF